MSARRQASTTSLSRYARNGSTDPNARYLDFCNAFWGPNDAGVDVLFARMRGAARTMEELRNFWKERVAIEEEYAKRLGKLAKMILGGYEIGELRNLLDTLRKETDKQSGFHLQLAQQIRNELENPVTAFVARQAQHRETHVAAIEKQFKTKQAQEVHVNKSREKYEQDCLRINAYTAQSTLVQGKDLERISVKLERDQQTVHANGREYVHFARALQESVAKWEQDWRQFCDSCQDLEDDRMDFTKDNVWAYANAVSIVCISDDEGLQSCERLRLALESFEPEKDQEGFVRYYGTGNAMPDLSPNSELSTMDCQFSAQKPAHRQDLDPDLVYDVSSRYSSRALPPPSFPTRPGSLTQIDSRSGGSLTPENHARHWTGKESINPLAPRLQVTSIDWLPDDVLLVIFDHFCALEYHREHRRGKKKEIEAWLPLVHVSRRWRTVVFGSPRRLNLRIFCTPETPVRFMLSVWPALPLIIGDMPLKYGSPYNPIWSSTLVPNIIALIKLSNRVCQINLHGVPHPHMEEVLAAMQAPFPELTYLTLWSNEETEPVLSDSFLGGSAPHLQSLQLNRIPFPGLSKLLSSATHLASISLHDIPHTGYISPEVMVTALSALKGLRSLLLKFQSPRSCPDRESRRPFLLTRSVFPVLTFIEFKGVSEYLDDLVAGIDVPQLNSLYITFFNQIVFDTPQTVRFFNRTPALKSLDKARVEFGGRAAEVHLSSRASAHGKLDVKILCGDLDWQVSSTEQVFTSCLPFISPIEVLCIHKTPNTSLEHWPDNIENRLWLELLHPFTALKILYISKEFVPRILPALQELVGDRTTEVLPALQNLFLERREPSGTVQEGIGQFIAQRQVTSHPVVVSRWGGDSRWFDRGGDEWSWFEKRANKL